MAATLTGHLFDRAPEGRSLLDYAAVLRRRRGAFIVTASLIALVAVATALLLPSRYRSHATILIEQQEIPQEMVRSTVTSYADQRIQLISQRVMTSANLLEIIRRYGLFADQRRRISTEALVERMRDSIEFETISAEVVDPRSGRPTEATIALSLAFESDTPQRAQAVANELASLYLNENLKKRTQLAADASNFLADESARLSERMNRLARELAAFKERHAGSLPELNELNLQLMDRTENELREVERQQGAQEQNLIMLRGQLAQLEPNRAVAAVTLDGERSLLDPRDQLVLLRTRYLSLSARYSPQHPDVLRARKEMEALGAELDPDAARDAVALRLAQARDELRNARERYSAEHPDVRRLERTIAALEQQARDAPARAAASAAVEVRAPDNPAWVEIRTRIDATESDLASLSERRATLADKLAGLEQRLVLAPQVEREYRDLLRDYDNASREYQEIRARQMEAQLAQTLESEQKGERFNLIEPPLLPEEPASPNRPGIALLGLVFALIGGAGAAAVAEGADGSVRGSASLARLLGQAPLAAIPEIVTSGERRRRALGRAALLTLVGVAMAAAAAAVHWLVLPLDVAWFALARRLGLEIGS